MPPVFDQAMGTGIYYANAPAKIWKWTDDHYYALFWNSSGYGLVYERETLDGTFVARPTTISGVSTSNTYWYANWAELYGDDLYIIPCLTTDGTLIRYNLSTDTVTYKTLISGQKIWGAGIMDNGDLAFAYADSGSYNAPYVGKWTRSTDSVTTGTAVPISLPMRTQNYSFCAVLGNERLYILGTYAGRSATYLISWNVAANTFNNLQDGPVWSSIANTNLYNGLGRMFEISGVEYMFVQDSRGTYDEIRGILIPMTDANPTIPSDFQIRAADPNGYVTYDRWTYLISKSDYWGTWINYVSSRQSYYKEGFAGTPTRLGTSVAPATASHGVCEIDDAIFCFFSYFTYNSVNQALVFREGGEAPAGSPWGPSVQVL